MARTKGKKTSSFRGECFVFNKRVAVTVGIQQTERYVLCHECRGPMDRQLLLPPRSKSSCDRVVVGIVEHVNVSEEMVSDSDGRDNDDNAYDEEETVKDEEERHYHDLTRNMPDLPPLCYDDMTGRHYLPGLTCLRCHAKTTRKSLERFVERERQVTCSCTILSGVLPNKFKNQKIFCKWLQRKRQPRIEPWVRPRHPSWQRGR
jgi:predicted sulfurtransferase